MNKNKVTTLRQIAALAKTPPRLHLHRKLGGPSTRLFVYHEGYLPVDREKDKTLHRMANMLYAASTQGHVRLTQKRISDGVYQYQAREIVR